MTGAAHAAPLRHPLRPVLAIVGLTAALCAALILWAFAGPLSGVRPIGDGDDPASYGFDLSADRFDGGVLVSSGHARDFLMALDDPATTPGVEMADVNRNQRGKELVGSDRVVGVVVQGEARAYPLTLLNAHEVVNDTLGGIPIAVTFSPLADAPAVVDRRLRDRVARFRVSGLLLDSTLLVYDAEEPTDRPSLFAPVRGMAVTGAAAADEVALTLLPDVQLVAWRDWLATHPSTTVARRDPSAARRYRQFNYRRYLDGDAPLFPVGRPVPEGGPRPMDAMLVLRRNGHTIVRTIDSLLNAGRSRIDAALGDETASFVPDSTTRTVRVEAPADTIIRHGLWFALHAADPSLATHIELDAGGRT